MTPGELAARKYVRHLKTRKRVQRQRRMLLGVIIGVCAALALLAACASANSQDPKETAKPVAATTRTHNLEPIVTKPPLPEPSKPPVEDTTPDLEEPEIEPDLGIHYVSTDAIKYRDDIVTQGVFLEYELQYILQSCCNSYEVPYPLMLAIAEVESHFDPDAVSSAGDQGLMQINPINNEWLTELGMDPTTYHGNIEAAVYIMAGYLERCEDTEMALMAYNNGPTGARRLWDAGTYQTSYTRKVMAALEYWTNLLEE